jgi:hypothetical protein
LFELLVPEMNYAVIGMRERWVGASQHTLFDPLQVLAVPTLSTALH